MYNIENISTEPCTESRFVQLERIRYTQDGVEKAWDVAKVFDSVAVLLYHTQKEAFILVKQFRPPVYLKNGDGFTHELCAGIVDKELSLAQIASEEINEECGYDVSAEHIREITSYHTAVGFAGAKQTLFYAEIDESMKIHEGGGIDHEAIEVLEMPVSEAKAFILDASRAKTPGIMYAMMWWFDNR